LTFHTWDSRRSEPGFPDLVLVRPPRVVFVETKTERGRIRRDQRKWLDQLAACEAVEAYLVRPSDAGRILEVLRRRDAEPEPSSPAPPAEPEEDR
jgi:VRR-NUC domain